MLFKPLYDRSSALFEFRRINVSEQVLIIRGTLGFTQKVGFGGLMEKVLCAYALNDGIAMVQVRSRSG